MHLVLLSGVLMWSYFMSGWLPNGESLGIAAAVFIEPQAMLGLNIWDFNSLSLLPFLPLFLNE